MFILIKNQVTSKFLLMFHIKNNETEDNKRFINIQIIMSIELKEV